MRARTPAYGAVGFNRFMDRLLMHGLEAFNLYYGVYRAKVIDVQGFGGGLISGAIGGSSDKEKQGLLKVRVPAIGDTDKTPPRTAYPIMPLAGDGFALKSLPPKGSFTWVFFEGGRTDMPVWIGGWFRQGDMPERLEHTDAQGWVSPKGQSLIFDELGNAFLEEGGPGPPGLGLTQLNLGREADEAMVRGDTLKSLLDELFDALLAMTVNTVGGPSTPPLNAAQFQAIKARLVTFLSKVIKVK